MGCSLSHGVDMEGEKSGGEIPAYWISELIGSY